VDPHDESGSVHPSLITEVPHAIRNGQYKSPEQLLQLPARGRAGCQKHFEQTPNEDSPVDKNGRGLLINNNQSSVRAQIPTPTESGNPDGWTEEEPELFGVDSHHPE